MRLSQLDLNLFLVFDAVYSRRNLTHAAEVLCITQPAVSNALNRLRKSLNDPLFVSTPRGMVPTPVADNIAERVRDALDLLGSSVHESEQFEPAKARKVFRLSMNDLSERLLLPVLTEQLSLAAPGVQIESYFTPRTEVAQELEAGVIDLAIDAPLIDDPQLVHQRLMNFRYVCFLRDGHPWQGRSLTLQRYLQLGHIHISSRRKGPGVVDAALHRLGHSRDIRMRVQHYLVAPLIAMRSDLALTGPDYLLRGFEGRVMNLPFEVPDTEWHMYWHRSKDRDPANTWLRGLIAQCLQELDDRRTPARKRS